MSTKETRMCTKKPCHRPTQEDIDRLVSVLASSGVDMGRVTVLRQVKAPKANKTSYLPASTAKEGPNQ